MELTRARLERLVDPVIRRCRPAVERALEDASVTPKDIDRIVFVGGPTRMPAVRKFFEDLFGRKAEMGVDPMECVASGAAIQAGVISGEVSDIVLVDVTPLTLGVETLGGVATALIERNTPIPVRHMEPFTTAADMQTSVTVRVIQGERPMAADNTQLGLFNLDGIPPAPRGIPKIEVAFDIDANGILDVSAKDTATGKSQSIRISGSTRLPKEEKERMVRVAEEYAEADKKRRDEVEKLNLADALCYEGEKTMAEHGQRLPDDLRERIETAMREVREAQAQGDADLAGERADKLRAVLQEVGTVLYQAAAAAQPEEAPPPPGAEPPTATTSRPSGGRVVDADFTDATPR
jgi:molecular chaperone DnaK